MTDDKLADLLRTAADGDPLPPIDPGQVAGRGERSLLRRRRLVAVGAGAATAAAVALAVVPGRLATGGSDPAATVSATPAATAEPAGGDFTPLPKVPSGEDALSGLTTSDVLYRCGLRYPQYRGERRLEIGWPVVGSTVTYQLRVGEREKHCTVPGDSRPSAKLVRAATADPMPSDQRAMLRNCSVLMWHDLTGWRVVATDREPGYLLNVVAVSPSGRNVMYCSLTADLFAREQPGAENRQIATTDGADNSAAQGIPDRRSPATSIAGGAFSQGTAICRGSVCVGFLYDNMGRVPSNVARIKLTAPNGRSHEVRVNDGWFALAWGDRIKDSHAELTVTAYDARGNRLR